MEEKEREKHEDAGHGRASARARRGVTRRVGDGEEGGGTRVRGATTKWIERRPAGRSTSQ